MERVIPIAPIVLTVKEVAETLKISEAEVRRLIKARKLDALFFGRKKSRIRIPAFALEDFARREVAEARRES